MFASSELAAAELMLMKMIVIHCLNKGYKVVTFKIVYEKRYQLADGHVSRLTPY